MRQHKVMAALLIPLALLAVLVMMAQAQALTPPPPQAREIGTTDTTGETTNWLTSTTAGFVVRYPPDWQRRILPDQSAGTQIVEFTHNKNGRVDASIQVLETWLLPGETWEQTPELKFWREQGARTNRLVESVLVARHMGWMVSAQLPLHRGDLARTVFVGRDGRLYRFRLYLYQSEATELYMQVLGLMMGTLQSVKDAAMSPIVMSPAPTPQAHDIAPSGLTTSTLNYNRGLAYVYAWTWWNKRNNSDGCYLWYNGSVLDCTYHEGDWGVDGAHFVNQVVRAGGRPIPPLLPDWPYEARTVPALRTWLLNDGWTAVPAAQAQVGDVVIIGNQCWAGLIVEPGNPPVAAAHSAEWWDPAGDMQCDGNTTKEYLHAPQGGFFIYLPVVTKKYPIPIKTETGMHLGSRNTSDKPEDIGWTAAMLQPLDGDKGGVWLS